ncbi:MAG: hypothetical protein ACW967_00445 [Candidatus Hodarchaeales archaeon]|jgi:hypothetical protein
MTTFRPQIVDINNFNWMEDEFEEKYARIMKTFDRLLIFCEKLKFSIQEIRNDLNNN